MPPLRRRLAAVHLVLGALLALAATEGTSAAQSRVNASGTWSAGDNGATPLANATTEYCFLTGVAGAFAGVIASGSTSM